MRVQSIVRGSGIVFYGNLGPLRNEELLCDYHQLLVKFLSPSEREESSKQVRPRSISGQVHTHDREHLSGLASMRRPQMGDLMQFLQGRKLITDVSSSTGRDYRVPLSLLEDRVRRIQRQTKRVASDRAVAEEAWKREEVATWSNAQYLVATAVALSHPKNGYKVLMFPDASDNHWGSVWTRLPKTELEV